MSVSEQEIERAAEAMERMNRDGGNPSYAEMARATLPILRPEGSELYCRCGNPWPKTPCGTACHARPK